MQEGNFYEMVQTDKGIFTFRHQQTGELLHAQEGPWEEAQKLYIGQSDLLIRKEPSVIFDVGMGCATLTLALLDAFEKNQEADDWYIYSFDLEKKGLENLLEKLEFFPFAHHFRDFIFRALKKDSLVYEKEGRKCHWHFMKGDFLESIGSYKGPQASHVFFDFFSPSSHPFLWHYEVFQHLEKHVQKEGLLYTYSCATAVRANLLASSFFVGYGVASGKRSLTTMASKTFASLKQPLPSSWKDTFLRSQKPFLEGEKDFEKVKEAILKHPQFSF